MSSRLKNVVRNSFWGISCKIVQIIFPFLVRTIMIHAMGNEYTGLNGLFTSILKILSLTELGFSSAITYNMYAPIAHDDKGKICALLNIYKRIYRIVGFVILGIGTVLLPFLKYSIHGSYPSDINIYILYVIYLANTCLSYFLFAYRTSLLNAYQRYDIISIVSLTSSVAMYILEISVLLLTENYYMYAASALLTTLINNCLVSLQTKRLFPQIKCSGNLDKEVIADIKKRVSALLGHRIGTAVITSADNVVISSFLGLTAVTYYNNYYYIISALISFIDTVLGGMVASIGNYITLKSSDDYKKLFNQLNFILFWVVSWCAISYGCLIQDFIEVWLGKTYQYESLTTVLLFVLYFFTWKMRSVNVRFKEAAGMWSNDFWKPYVSAIANIVLNIVLVNIIGINGVLISTITTMVFINLPWETHVLYRDLFKSKELEYYISLTKRIVIAIAGGCVTYFICSKVDLDSALLRFLLKGLICCLVPNIILIGLYYLSDTEFEDVRIAIIRIIKENCRI